MINTPEQLPERALVTFALFAYNQEKYIREAVEGAFSQQYSPLEIILSDDCSSDRTLEIMEAMAREYRGPHMIKVRRGKRNVGVLAHVLSVAQMATGDILIVAAGDDISFPNRSKEIAQALSGTDCIGFSSNDIIIDEKGFEREWDKGRLERRWSWHSANQAWVHGASAAYSLKFLKALPIPNVPIFYEDMVLVDLIRLLGKRSVRSSEILVKYRHHFNNLSNRIQKNSSLKDIETQFLLHCRREKAAKKYCIDYIETTSDGLQVNNEVARSISLELAYLRRIIDWKTAKLKDRLELLYFAIRTGNLKSVLPRLFGRRVYFTLKRLRHA